MKIFSKLNMFGEIEEEKNFYSRAYFRKHQELQKKNTEINILETKVNELEVENHELQIKIEALEKALGKKDSNGKNTRTKHNTRKPSVSRTRSK